MAGKPKIVVSQKYLERRYAEDRAYEEFKKSRVEDERREAEEKERAEYEAEARKVDRARKLMTAIKNHPRPEVNSAFDLSRPGLSPSVDAALEELESLALRWEIRVEEDNDDDL